MEPWSSFWQQGHSTTFGHFFRGGYEGAVKDWWVALLEPYSPSADILDIILIVNHILNVQSLSNLGEYLADVNQNSLINILDVILLINLILET